MSYKDICDVLHNLVSVTIWCLYVYYLFFLDEAEEMQLVETKGFTQALFATTVFSLEIGFKMQQGVWRYCNLWLKQHSNLLKMHYFFGCDKWCSYCFITPNSSSHILLNSSKNPVVSAFHHAQWHASTLQQCHLWLLFRIKLQ